jgi:hypothetical protein
MGSVISTANSQRAFAPGPNQNVTLGPEYYDRSNSWTEGDAVRSDSSIKKLPMEGIAGMQTDIKWEKWGDYPKQYRSLAVGIKMWSPPWKIDDVVVLCKCTDINTYIRRWPFWRQRLLAGVIKNPACYDDRFTIDEPEGFGIGFRMFDRDTFVLKVNYPMFYNNTVLSFMGGKNKKTRAKKRKSKRKTRRAMRAPSA